MFNLVLLDLSIAFDTFDHSILLLCLETWAGQKDSACSLLHSYVSNRTISVALGPGGPSRAVVSIKASFLAPLLCCFLAILSNIMMCFSIFKLMTLNFTFP